MPALVTRHESAGISSAVDAIVEGTGKPETIPIELIVPPESQSLFIAIAGPGPEGFRIGPLDTRANLMDAEGRLRDDLLVRGPDGQMLFFVGEPAAGRWTLTINAGPESLAGINTSIVAKGARGKLARLGPYLRCKTCKLTLKAFAVALFAYLGPCLATGLGLSAALVQVSALAMGAFDAIAKTLGIARAVLAGIFDNVKEFGEDPIDHFLGRCCRAAHLCDA
jgi:hypothetical protein